MQHVQFDCPHGPKDVEVASFWGDLDKDLFGWGGAWVNIVVGRCHHAALFKGHAVIMAWT